MISKEANKFGPPLIHKSWKACVESGYFPELQRQSSELEGNQVSYRGNQVSYRGNQVSYRGNQVSYRGNQVSKEELLCHIATEKETMKEI